MTDDSSSEQSPLHSKQSERSARQTSSSSNRITPEQAEAAEATTAPEEVSATETVSMRSSQSNVGGGQIRATIRQEAQVKKNLNLSYEYYEYFVYSQCLPAWILMLLRIAMGGVCTAVFLYMSIMAPFVNFGPSNSTSKDQNGTTGSTPTFKRHFYLCYLTIWSYLVITVYFLVTLFNTISHCVCAPSEDFRLSSGGFKSTENLLDAHSSAAAGQYSASSRPSRARQFCLRLQWLLCGVAANAALIVTVAYFGVLYQMVKRVNPGPISALDLLVHGFNSVFMLTEIACSGVPVRLVHALYTVLYGLCYALFSLLYWIPDHTNVIYPVLLDWNNAGLTIGLLCLLMFVGLPLVQLVWWLVYLMRCFVSAALVSQNGNWSPGLSV